MLRECYVLHVKKRLTGNNVILCMLRKSFKNIVGQNRDVLKIDIFLLLAIYSNAFPYKESP